MRIAKKSFLLLTITLLVFTTNTILFAAPTGTETNNNTTNNNANTEAKKEVAPQIDPKTLPESVTGERTDGGGTLVDYVLTGSRHFYTIRTKDGGTIYLIIDYDKEQDNVYFLTDIEQKKLTEGVTQQQEQEQKGEEEQVEKTTGQSNYTVLIVILVGLGVFAGIGYYVKVYKPKKKREEEMRVEEEPGKVAEENDYFDYENEEED